MYTGSHRLNRIVMIASSVLPDQVGTSHWDHPRVSERDFGLLRGRQGFLGPTENSTDLQALTSCIGLSLELCLTRLGGHVGRQLLRELGC